MGFKTTWWQDYPKKKWYGNFIPEYDTFKHKFFKSPREAAAMDLQQRLMLQTAYQAVSSRVTSCRMSRSHRLVATSE